MADKEKEFFERMVKDPIIVTKENQVELENAIDDGIRKLLMDLYGFQEDHSKMDTKLALGFFACCFAGVAAIFAHTAPFNESRWILGICCVGYFFFSGILNAYSHFIEGDQIFSGVKKDPLEQDLYITVQTHMKKYDENFSIKVALREKNEKTETKNEKTQSVGKWVDVKGQISLKELKKDMDKLLQHKKKQN